MRPIVRLDWVTRSKVGFRVLLHTNDWMHLGFVWTKAFSGLALLSALFICSLTAQGAYSIGVYYYPGWSPAINGPGQPDPWQAPFELIPNASLCWVGITMVGWKPWKGSYSGCSNSGSVLSRLTGIGEVVVPGPETSLRAYLAAPSRAKVKYALLWANHFPQTNVEMEWARMVDYWLTNHLKNPEYLQIDGRPVVFIFSGDFLRDNAAASGVTAKELLSRAQQKARAAGLMGIYFVLATPALEYWTKGFAPDAGFSALSAYNYHMGYAGTPATAHPYFSQLPGIGCRISDAVAMDSGQQHATVFLTDDIGMEQTPLGWKYGGSPSRSIRWHP